MRDGGGGDEAGGPSQEAEGHPQRHKRPSLPERECGAPAPRQHARPHRQEPLAQGAVGQPLPWAGGVSIRAWDPREVGGWPQRAPRRLGGGGLWPAAQCEEVQGVACPEARGLPAGWLEELPDAWAGESHSSGRTDELSVPCSPHGSASRGGQGAANPLVSTCAASCPLTLSRGRAHWGGAWEGPDRHRLDPGPGPWCGGTSRSRGERGAPEGGSCQSRAWRLPGPQQDGRDIQFPALGSVPQAPQPQPCPGLSVNPTGPRPSSAPSPTAPPV